MDAIALSARQARYKFLTDKLARDAGLTTALVGSLAEKTGLSVDEFAKEAYADPPGFVEFLKLASAPAEEQSKQANVLSKLLRRPAYTQPALPGMGESRFGSLSRRFLSGMNRNFNPVSGGLRGRLGAGGALTGALAGGYALSGGAGGQAATPAATPKTETNAAAPKAPGASQGGQEASPGMPPLLKALLIGGGVGLGGLGVYKGVKAMKGKKKDDKEASFKELAYSLLKRTIVKKAMAWRRHEAATMLGTHLDRVAAHLPIEKQARLRTLQREISSGKNLSESIKLAYPHLSGEQRGILAVRLVRSALSSKQALYAPGATGTTAAVAPKRTMAMSGPGPRPTQSVRTVQPRTFSGPVSKARPKLLSI